MKKVLLAVGLSLGMVTASWGASDNIITTGKKGGTYIRVGHNLKGLIGGKVVTSKGGEENIKRIGTGEAVVGISQMDTYAYMAEKNPNIKSVAELIGPLYREAVYIVGNCNGRVRDEDDLQQEGVTIATGSKGSGGASTWNYMRELEPGYKKAAVVPKGGIRALGKLASRPDGDIDAVLFVTKPVMTGKLITTVLKNENLCFINVNDKDLNDKYKPTGKPVYEFCKIDVAKGFLNDTELHTICMDAVIIANSDAGEEYLEELSDAVLNYGPSLIK